MSLLNVHYSAFSPEKKNGKRGFNLMVVNGKLYVTNSLSKNYLSEMQRSFNVMHSDMTSVR